MKFSTTVTVTKPDANEVTISRKFDAPRQLVFDAHTKPEMVKRWLYGPEDWPLVVCEIDLRVGGRLRYVWRNRNKGDMGMSGIFKEVVPGQRVVHSEIFDDDWTGGETLVTTIFEEEGGRTTVTATVRYSSEAARDAALKTGMMEGWARALARLQGLLATTAT